MARRDFFSHTCPDGRSAASRLNAAGIQRIWHAENLHKNAGGTSASRSVDWLMNSPPHRAEILNPRYTHMGVGFQPHGITVWSYWTQLFIQQ